MLEQSKNRIWAFAKNPFTNTGGTQCLQNVDSGLWIWEMESTHILIGAGPRAALFMDPTFYLMRFSRGVDIWNLPFSSNSTVSWLNSQPHDHEQNNVVVLCHSFGGEYLVKGTPPGIQTWMHKWFFIYVLYKTLMLLHFLLLFDMQRCELVFQLFPISVHSYWYV